MDIFTIRVKLTFFLLVSLIIIIWRVYISSKSEEKNCTIYSKVQNRFKTLATQSRFDAENELFTISDEREFFEKNFAMIIAQNSNIKGKLEKLSFTFKLRNLFLIFNFRLRDFGSNLDMKKFLKVLENQILKPNLIFCFSFKGDIGVFNYSKVWYCFERSNNCMRNFQFFQIFEAFQFISSYNKYCLKNFYYFDFEAQDVALGEEKGNLRFFTDQFKSSLSSMASINSTDFENDNSPNCGKFSSVSNYNSSSNEKLFSEKLVQKSKNKMDLNFSDINLNLNDFVVRKKKKNVSKYIFLIRSRYQDENKKIENCGLQSLISFIERSFNGTNLEEYYKYFLTKYLQQAFENKIAPSVFCNFNITITTTSYKGSENNNRLTEKFEIEFPIIKTDLKIVVRRKQNHHQEQLHLEKKLQIKLILKHSHLKRKEIILGEYKNLNYENPHSAHSDHPAHSSEYRNNISLVNQYEDELRLEAVKSVCERLSIEFPPYVIVRNSNKYMMNNQWFTYYAHRRTHEWSRGEKEEWIFHRVESKIFPFLNHNISQLVIITEDRSWESVVGSFALGKFSVFAQFSPKFEYINKFSRIYLHFKQDWKYSNIYLSYRRLERDYFEIETKLDSFDTILTFRLKCSPSEASLNCFAQAVEQNIWNTFDHNHVKGNISFAIVPFPLSWKSQIKLKEVFNVEEMELFHNLSSS